MSIRWRLGVLALQLLVLVAATKVVSGQLALEEPWFIAGLLAIVVNPQLIETPYPRPGHLIANVVIFLFLYWAAHDSPSKIGWNAAAVIFSIAALLAVIGVGVSNSAGRSRTSGVAFVARELSKIANGEVVFSVVFFLDLLRYKPSTSWEFWLLTVAWFAIVVLAHTNWHRLWSTLKFGRPTFLIESLTGPSILTVSGGSLPPQGSWVSLRSTSTEAQGIVIRRIPRRDDDWGQIHVIEEAACERLLTDQSLDINEKKESESAPVGSVDVGSTDTTLRFIATKPLEVGSVVSVPTSAKDDTVIFQLALAQIEHTDVKGGSHLFVRAIATQIGRFSLTEQRFRRHLWVPGPGAPVFAGHRKIAELPTPKQSEKLGHVIGTTLPVFLDLESASEGHLAIIGMTKMGKSTLAERLARRLAETRAVVVLDLTGEYVKKKNFAPYVGKQQLMEPGVSVCEPNQNDVPADKLLAFLRDILTKVATPEYQLGNPLPRTLIIDEAHQFIPEPAGIGFNAPGRESSYAIGLLMMQIRKYGISVILITQRTAVVAKSALSQCENLIAFRSVDQTGLDYLEAVAGGEVRSLLPQLQQGQALVFGPAISSDSSVAIDVGLVA